MLSTSKDSISSSKGESETGNEMVGKTYVLASGDAASASESDSGNLQHQYSATQIQQNWRQIQNVQRC